jgi:hypothetical protein
VRVEALQVAGVEGDRQVLVLRQLGRAGDARQQPENEYGNQENASGQSHDGLL